MITYDIAPPPAAASSDVPPPPRKKTISSPRARHWLGRLAHFATVLLLVTFGATLLSSLLPGSPAAAILGPTATPEDIATLEAENGWDQPLPVRYFNWLGNAVQGDFGNSTQSGEPVLSEILSRVPVTLELSLLALAISLLIAVPAAIYSASKEGAVVDRVSTSVASMLMSTPVFVAGVLLIYLLAVRTGWFPIAGWSPLSDGISGNVTFALLPALALALGEAPSFFRLLRADMITTLNEDFVTTATARGLPRWYVLLRHVLRPSSFSLLTVAAVTFGRLLAGSVVIESLFALPGIGNLVLQSIPARDITLVQGVVVFIALVYVVVNMAVDGLYAVLDPRVRTR